MAGYIMVARILSGIIALAGLVWMVYAAKCLLRGPETRRNMLGSTICFTVGLAGLIATSFLPDFIKEQKAKADAQTAAAEAEWQQALDDGYSFYLDGKEVDGKAINRKEYSVTVKTAERSVYLTKPDPSFRIILTAVFGVVFVISICSLMFRSTSPF